MQERDNLRGLIEALRRAVAADLPPPVQVPRLLGATQLDFMACACLRPDGQRRGSLRLQSFIVCTQQA